MVQFSVKVSYVRSPKFGLTLLYKTFLWKPLYSSYFLKNCQTKINVVLSQKKISLFYQVASPAYTELEVAMMNWLGKLLGLPDEFLNSSEGPGGGVIQGSASETTFVILLAAKEKMVKELQQLHPEMTEAEIKGKLVAYSSNQSNSSVEKAGLLGSMPMRLLPADEKGQLRGDVLEEAIRKDKEKGLIPCYVVANLGTTPTCAFDKLDELGPICQRENMWLHVDAAYAGSAFVCPEYR